MQNFNSKHLNTTSSNIKSILIHVVDGKRCFSIRIKTLHLLYTKVRDRIISNNMKYSHYYNPYDVPPFYFTYHGKPIPDTLKTYLDYGIHENSYLHIVFIGLVGGAQGNVLDLNPLFEFKFSGHVYFLYKTIYSRDSFVDICSLFLENLFVHRSMRVSRQIYGTLFFRIKIIDIYAQT